MPNIPTNRSPKFPYFLILSVVASIAGSVFNVTFISVPAIAKANPVGSQIESPTKTQIKNRTGNQVEKLARLSDGEQQERLFLIQTINQFLRDRNFKDAEENARKFITKFPKDAFGSYQLGNVLFAQNKPEEAIKSYQQAIALKPEYALAYNATGEVYASQYRWQEAINEYNKALNINPNYAQALTNLAQALWEQGKREEAIASLEKVVNLFKSQNQPDKAERIERILRDLRRTDDPSIS